MGYLKGWSSVEKVVFCLYDKENLTMFTKELESRLPREGEANCRPHLIRGISVNADPTRRLW
jgi:hypothetical protein